MKWWTVNEWWTKQYLINIFSGYGQWKSNCSKTRQTIQYHMWKTMYTDTIYYVFCHITCIQTINLTIFETYVSKRTEFKNGKNTHTDTVTKPWFWVLMQKSQLSSCCILFTHKQDGFFLLCNVHGFLGICMIQPLSWLVLSHDLSLEMEHICTSLSLYLSTSSLKLASRASRMSRPMLTAGNLWICV